MDARPLAVGAAKARRTLSGVGKGATKLTQALGPLGLAIGATTAALAGLAVMNRVIRIGAEFEAQMATVGGVMRATGEEMSQLRELALQMGEQTRFSATQAADALKFLGQTGFTAAQSMEALPGVLNLAAAAGTDLATTADIASNILKTFGLEVTELNRVNDVMIGTMTRSNVDMRQLAESMKFVGAVAKGYGFTIEETAGLIGKMGDAGIQGTLAGTQLARAIQIANKVAERYKLTSSDLIDVLGDLNERGATTTDIMKLFGRQGGRAALILRDMIPEVREFQTTLFDVGGEAKELADIKMATLQGAFLELRSVMETTAIKAFDTFRDRLETGVRAMIQWVRENKDAIADFAGFISRFVENVVRLIAGAFNLVRGVLGLVGKAFAGVIGESAEMRDSLIKDADAIRREYERLTDPTPWQELEFIVVGWSRNVLLALRAVVELAIEMVKASGRLIQLLWRQAVAPLEGVQQIFRVAALAYKGEYEQAADAVRDAISDAFTKSDDAMDDFLRDSEDAAQGFVGVWRRYTDDFKTPYQLMMEDLEEFKTANEDFVTALEADFPEAGGMLPITPIGIAPPPLPFTPIIDQAAGEITDMQAMLDRFAKDTEGSVLTSNDEMAKSGAKAAGQMVDAHVRAFERIMAVRENSIRAFENILESGTLKGDELMAVWKEYEALAIEVIREEERMFAIMNDNEVLARQNANVELAKLEEERKKIFERANRDMVTDAERAGGAIGDAFEQSFSAGLMGRFETLGDFILDFFRNIFSELSRMFARFVGKQIARGFGNFFGDFLGDLFKFQAGGLVAGPTLAVVGEVPELIIPLSKLHDAEFLGGGRGDINVSMVVKTEDLRGFQASKQQLAANLGVAISTALGRNR
jgi:TP901 family phage tail tape measure protein